MAHHEHVAIVRRGVKCWKRWRQENPHIKPDLCGANLSGIYLIGANLSEVDLTAANLSNAKLIGADFRSANLSRANLSRADLFAADLRNTDLSRADLFAADLRRADLSRANLSMANLNRVQLSEVQARETNFSQALLTGACIEDWQIDSQTNFFKVRCSYLYRGWNRETEQFICRRSFNPSSSFQAGEITKFRELHF